MSIMVDGLAPEGGGEVAVGDDDRLGTGEGVDALCTFLASTSPMV